MSFWVEVQCEALLDEECHVNNGTDSRLMASMPRLSDSWLWQKARELGWKKRNGKMVCPACQKLM